MVTRIIAPCETPRDYLGKGGHPRDRVFERGETHSAEPRMTPQPYVQAGIIQLVTLREQDFRKVRKEGETGSAPCQLPVSSQIESTVARARSMKETKFPPRVGRGDNRGMSPSESNRRGFSVRARFAPRRTYSKHQ